MTLRFSHINCDASFINPRKRVKIKPMQYDSSLISQNLATIRANIEKAALRSRRNPSEITLVAVTKTVEAGAILIAIKCGVKVIGESKVQEALKKQSVVAEKVEWHFIGPLQKNKAKFVPGKFDLVHSVDSYELALELDRRARAVGLTVPILLEINIGEEKSKHGVMPLEATNETQKISKLENLRLKGLMAIPPQSEHPEDSRKFFKKVVEIKKELEQLKLEKASFGILSFGMTDDYEIAVEEGATHLRIGRGVFGERQDKT